MCQATDLLAEATGMSFIECTAMSIAPDSMRLFDFSGEKTFAADLFQGAINDLVASGLDHDDGEGFERQIEPPWTVAHGLVGLCQSQRRSTGADLEGLGGGGQINAS